MFFCATMLSCRHAIIDNRPLLMHRKFRNIERDSTGSPLASALWHELNTQRDITVVTSFLALATPGGAIVIDPRACRAIKCQVQCS